ncbi:MAG: GNAT family N-acetyltransferase [Hyphomicrobiaceae bacterium]
MDVHVREATAADRDAILALHAKLHNVERTLHPNRAPVEEIGNAATIERDAELAKNDGCIFVAERDGEIIGCVVTTIDDGDAYLIESDRRFGWIRSISVSEEARGAGVGRALMKAAEGRFRNRGLSQIQVYVLAANDRAQSFYADNGFHPYEISYEKRLDGLDVPKVTQ